MWPLFSSFTLHTFSLPISEAVSQTVVRVLRCCSCMHAMQVGWLGDENGDWAEIRFGFGSSNQVQGTVLFAPRSSTEASDVDGV
jgi:hypothetical protein